MSDIDFVTKMSFPDFFSTAHRPRFDPADKIVTKSMS